MLVPKRLLSVLFVFHQLTFANFGTPYDSIQLLPEKLWGWMGNKNQKYLEKFIKENNPQKVVEIGTWLGMSAIFMAKRLSDGATLYCIDPWKPYKDMDNIPQCQEPLKTAYEQFLSNCIHNQVTHKIKPMRMTSMQALYYFSNDIDLIYIDGSHAEEDVYNDIIAWYSKKAPNGVLCGDDLGWPSVYRAVIRAKKQLGVNIISDGNFWWIE